jgi:hypothetical protein
MYHSPFPLVPWQPWTYSIAGWPVQSLNVFAVADAVAVAGSRLLMMTLANGVVAIVAIVAVVLLLP